MSSPLDEFFGVIYLAPEAFLARAKTFGVDPAGLGPDDVSPALAIASRAADAHTGRTFVPDAIEETHRWDPQARRVSVNQPPVLELVSLRVRFAPGDPGSVVTFSPSEVLVNNQENYLELAPYAPADVALAQLGPGLREPQVEIRYKSFQSVPPAVAAAVGFTAAHFLNESKANEFVPAGLASYKVANTAFGRRSEGVELPAIAKQLLSPFVRIAIG